VLSGRGLCDGPIPRPEESYRLRRGFECDQVKTNPLYTCCEQVRGRGKDCEKKLKISFPSSHVDLVGFEGAQAPNSCRVRDTYINAALVLHQHITVFPTYRVAFKVQVYGNYPQSFVPSILSLRCLTRFFISDYILTPLNMCLAI
jgi:hypothetical protein